MPVERCHLSPAAPVKHAIHFDEVDFLVIEAIVIPTGF
jgi:hypothetical protein